MTAGQRACQAEDYRVQVWETLLSRNLPLSLCGKVGEWLERAAVRAVLCENCGVQCLLMTLMPLRKFA